MYRFRARETAKRIGDEIWDVDMVEPRRIGLQMMVRVAIMSALPPWTVEGRLSILKGKQRRLSFFMPGADRVQMTIVYHHSSWNLWIQ